MQYRYLGRTGVEVSAFCLGTMMFGGTANPDHQDCIRIIHAAIDCGVNFVDTADMYFAGETETIVGKALGDRRDQVILATKGHFQMGDGRNRKGNSRVWLTRAVEDSLRRLRTDWIDLYQVHRTDPQTDIAEVLDTLTGLVRAGKIRMFGSSYTAPADMVEAWHVAQRRSLMSFHTEQPSYSLMTRGAERAALPTARRLELGVLVSSPLAWGFLSGKYRLGRDVDLSSGRAAMLPQRFDPSLEENRRKFEVVEELLQICEQIGCTLPQLAVAFTSCNPAVTSTIIGPRTMEQLRGLLDTTITLDDTILDRIDAIVAPGTNLYEPNTAVPHELSNTRWRRRPIEERRPVVTSEKKQAA